MKITVYCGAAAGNDPAYLDAARRLGIWIADRGYELVYGAGRVGMMGMIADTVLERGGRVTGVIPAFMVELGWCHKGLSECLIEEDMSSRKKKMCELADAIIALPGGAGTLEEISEMISWQRLGQNDSPCILFDEKGFYRPLREVYTGMIEAGFMEEEAFKRVLFSNDIDEIEAFIASFSRTGRTASGGYQT